MNKVCGEMSDNLHSFHKTGLKEQPYLIKLSASSFMKLIFNGPLRSFSLMDVCHSGRVYLKGSSRSRVRVRYIFCGYKKINLFYLLCRNEYTSHFGQLPCCVGGFYADCSARAALLTSDITPLKKIPTASRISFLSCSLGLTLNINIPSAFMIND